MKKLKNWIVGYKYLPTLIFFAMVSIITPILCMSADLNVEQDMVMTEDGYMYTDSVTFVDIYVLPTFKYEDMTAADRERFLRSVTFEEYVKFIAGEKNSYITLSAILIVLYVLMYFYAKFIYNLGHKEKKPRSYKDIDDMNIYGSSAADEEYSVGQISTEENVDIPYVVGSYDEDYTKQKESPTDSSIHLI